MRLSNPASYTAFYNPVSLFLAKLSESGGRLRRILHYRFYVETFAHFDTHKVPPNLLSVGLEYS